MEIIVDYQEQFLWRQTEGVYQKGRGGQTLCELLRRLIGNERVKVIAGMGRHWIYGLFKRNISR